MPILRKNGNISPSILRRRSGSAWANITAARRRISGSWVSVLGLSAAAAPGSVSGSSTTPVNGPTSVNINTTSTTVTPTSGVTPYSYAWTLIASNGSWSINNPSSATCSFNALSVLRNETRTGTFRCTVTDTIGQTAIADISASAQHVWLA